MVDDNLIYKDECLFVCLYLIQNHISNYAHISPVVWKRLLGMYGPIIFHLSHLFDLFCRERVQIRVQ